MLPIIGLVAAGAAAVSAITYAVSESGSSGGSSPAPGPSAAEAQKKARTKERKAEFNGLLKRYGIVNEDHAKMLRMLPSSRADAAAPSQSVIRDALKDTAWVQERKTKAEALAKQEQQLEQLQHRMAKL